MNNTDILGAVKEADVHFIRLQFTDISGKLKNLAITESVLERALDEGVVFDGSALDGPVRGNERELILKPDLDTFSMLPWRPQTGSVARLICDVYNPDGTPFVGDGRRALKEQTARLQAAGLGMDITSEVEFFLLNLDDSGNPAPQVHDRGGYFDVAPHDKGENVRRDICLNLESMGFAVEHSLHGQSHGQHCISLSHADALSAADNLATFKLVVRTIARTHGLHATFMPQPSTGVHGSGMHLFTSLLKGDADAFAGELDFGLSELAMQFMGGLLEHAAPLCFLLNPTVNSYRRLIPGDDAPTLAAWTPGDSNLMLHTTRRNGLTRVELRSPDPYCNPYLGIASMIAAGMDGMDKELHPGVPGLTPNDIDYNATLPASLAEALAAFYEDSVLQDAIGPYIADKLMLAKQGECDYFRQQVTLKELEVYLSAE